MFIKDGLVVLESVFALVSKVIRRHVVIAFDLVERSLLEIPLPPDLTAELLASKSSYYDDCHLRVLGGCLSLCYWSGADGHEMTKKWVMKEYKVQSSWTKSFVVMSNFMPMCFTEGGEVLGSDGSGRFEKFNDKGELLENHTYGQAYKGALKYFDMYRESLLALPSELS